MSDTQKFASEQIDIGERADVAAQQTAPRR